MKVAMPFTISDLRQRPEFFDIVADRIWQAWWRADGHPLDYISGRLRENMNATPIPIALVAHDGKSFLGTASVIASDLPERPQLTPWVAAVSVEAHTRRRAVGGAVDRDVNRKIDQGDEPEPRRDNQDQHHCNRKVHKAMRQQWERPAPSLVLADRHPRVLQEEIRNDVLGGEEQHPSHQGTNRNRRRHGGKRQS